MRKAMMKKVNLTIGKSDNKTQLPIFENRCCYCNHVSVGTFKIALTSIDVDSINIELPYCEKHLKIMESIQEILASPKTIRTKIIASIIGIIVGLVTWSFFIKIKIMGLPIGLLWPGITAFVGYSFGNAFLQGSTVEKISNEFDIPANDLFISSFLAKNSDTDYSTANRDKISLGVGCTISKEDNDSLSFKLRFANDEYADSFANANNSVIAN